MRQVKSSYTWEAIRDAIRNFELARRAPEALEQYAKTPFPRLSREPYNLVYTTWVKRRDVWRYAQRVSDREEIGWSPAYENQHVQWNLRLPDCVLIEEFKKQIHVFRGSRNIEVSHAMTCRNSRAAGWKYIELLDRSKCKDNDEPLDHSMLSKAKKMAAKYAKELNQAYEKWINTPPDTLWTVLSSLSQENDGFGTINSWFAQELVEPPDAVKTLGSKGVFASE